MLTDRAIDVLVAVEGCFVGSCGSREVEVALGDLAPEGSRMVELLNGGGFYARLVGDSLQVNTWGWDD